MEFYRIYKNADLGDGFNHIIPIINHYNHY